MEMRRYLSPSPPGRSTATSACMGSRKVHVEPSGPMPRKRAPRPGSARTTTLPRSMSTQMKMMNASLTAKKVVKTGRAKSVFAGPRDNQRRKRVMRPQMRAKPRASRTLKRECL